MVELPDMTLPTVLNIYRTYEDHAEDWRRDHLGASQIGGECERSLWYTFRWASNPRFEGRILRLFESGKVQEPRLIKNLRDIGVEVCDVDPDTGLQIRFEMFGGHYSGSCDAIARGFEESKQWHIVEFKTMNTRGFTALKRNGVRATKPEYYCQMQQYMKWSDLERAYFFCVCKDTDDIYGERIELDKDLVSRLEMKAERVIFADEPPFKISDTDSAQPCRFCNHKNLCRGLALPEVSCRTCAFVTPDPNGTWTCARSNNRVLCKAEQRTVHDCHVFIPALVPLEQTDSDPEKGTVSYGEIVNGPGATLSQDMKL